MHFQLPAAMAILEGAMPLMLGVNQNVNFSFSWLGV